MNFGVRSHLLPCTTLSLLAIFPGCGTKQEQQHLAMASDVSVSVSTVKRQKLESSLALVGSINASADVNVISETQGTVKTVMVKVGMKVVEGTILVKVDDEIPRSTASAAEINFQKAQRDFERAEQLYQENSLSPSQLDASRLAMKAAANQLDIARRQLENTRIKSPIAGTVNARYVEVGTMVQPGKPVANIVNISTLKVQVNVAEREAFRLKVGEHVGISTEVYPGVIFDGLVDNIAAKADEGHTYPVEILLRNSPKHPLKAGMFARVLFQSTAPFEALTIPRVALIGSIKDAQVYIVRGAVSVLRSIVIGRQSAGLYEVTSGLAEGDTVVVSGHNNLTEGAHVQVVNVQP